MQRNGGCALGEQNTLTMVFVFVLSPMRYGHADRMKNRTQPAILSQFMRLRPALALFALLLCLPSAMGESPAREPSLTMASLAPKRTASADLMTGVVAAVAGALTAIGVSRVVFGPGKPSIATGPRDAHCSVTLR